MPREPKESESFAIDAESLKTILTEVMGAVKQDGLTPEVIKAIAQTASEAASASQREPPSAQVSHLNPLGERDHPRDDIQGEVYWVGARLDKFQLTQEEISLVNQLVPGEYWFRGNDDRPILFRAVNLEPAGSNRRRLLCLFPCVDPDQRQNLPPMRRMLADVVRSALAGV